MAYAIPILTTLHDSLVVINDLDETSFLAIFSKVKTYGYLIFALKYIHIK